MLLIPEASWEVRGRAFSSDDFGKHNRGVFALHPIPGGTVIGDYLGLLIPNEQEAEYESGRDIYMMSYDAELSIWPDQAQPGIHLINHSCEPNCGIVTYQGHSLYVALRKIHPEEELTVSYLLAPIDDECAPCRHACRCRRWTSTRRASLTVASSGCTARPISRRSWCRRTGYRALPSCGGRSAGPAGGWRIPGSA
jgi:SET domain-containing protein